MKTSILPVFNGKSSMHRVFGDDQPSTDIHIQENVLSPVLMQRECPDGIVTIRTRSWHRIETYIAGKSVVVTRFECYFNGVLVDYTRERNLIVKTFRWLSKMGQIHKAA
jgi:hypothetical protein